MFLTGTFLSSVLQNLNIHSTVRGDFERRSSVVLCTRSQPPCLCDLSSTAKPVAVFPILSTKANEGAGFDYFSSSPWADGISHQSKQAVKEPGEPTPAPFAPNRGAELPTARRDPPGIASSIKHGCKVGD